MSEAIADLIADIEREQSALVALIEANLRAEVIEEAEAMAERHRRMEPIMRRLGEATRRLAETAADQGIPAELAPKIETWRTEIAALIGAIQHHAGDLADRRTLITSTLQRLHQATKGITGYRQHRAKGARYIQKQA